MDRPPVYRVSKKILMMLDEARKNPSGKAVLANLRSSIGKELGDNMESLAFVFANIPEEYLGEYEDLNYFEDAILTSLQLYATYQQGEEESLLILDGENKFSNMGKALRQIRSEDKASIDLRFNAMVTSTSSEELKNHLRQMIKILKAKKDPKVKVDFSQLAQDLFSFNIGNKDPIRIRWARDFYRTTAKKKDQENNEERENENDK